MGLAVGLEEGDKSKGPCGQGSSTVHTDEQ